MLSQSGIVGFPGLVILLCSVDPATVIEISFICITVPDPGLRCGKPKKGYVGGGIHHVRRKNKNNIKRQEGHMPPVRCK